MNKLFYGLLITLLLFSFSFARAEVSAESIAQILQRLENLERKIRELHGENEVLTHEIKRLKDLQKQGFLNIDERIDEIQNLNKSHTTPQSTQKKTPQPRVKIVGKKPVPVKAAATPQPGKPQKNNNPVNNKNVDSQAKAGTKGKSKKTRAPSAYEKAVYQDAFVLMKKSPSAATKAFREYIKLQPDSPLAANAQYWIGEIMYSHNNYRGAVQEFIKVLQNYKYSDKAPDAAIKLGYSFYALKNWKFARRTFEDVLRYFPDNKNAVMLAKKRLEKMKAAGH